MRSLLAILAACIGIVSILLTGRYGWKQADLEVDRWIAAIMFGSISLCAFIFDAVAVRLWFRGARKASGFIGLIAALAFVVTFSNSLGGIVSRADVVQAQRHDALTSREDARRELHRLEKALADLGRFTPTDDAALRAADAAVTTTTNRRVAECGQFNEKRGNLCKQREAEEATAATSRATSAAAKATTDTARRYEAQIAAIKQRQSSASGEAVGSENPLGKALANIIGSTADTLTSWQQAVIALVFELCLVGLMVGHTTLGEVGGEPKDTKVALPTGADTEQTHRGIPEIPSIVLPIEPPKFPEPPRPILIASSAEQPAGSIPKLLTSALEPAPGQRVEMADVYRRYRMDCAAEEKRALPPDQFVDPLARFCKVAGIRTKATGQKVYLINVRLVAATGDLLAPSTS
jgi:hypothetical protein